MIFFVLPKTDPLKLDLIRIPNNNFASQRLKKKDAFVLILWSEVYSSLEGMLIAIQEAALQDPICLSYLKRFKRFYAIDLFQRDNPLFEKMWDTLFYWSHPLVGNLINSPKVRPVRWNNQYGLNWKYSSALSETSKSLLEPLAKEMGELRRATRDQCRICSNIVELARAFLGEMTCFFTRKLEKILALRLCRSKMLYSVQHEMLTAFSKDETRVNRVLTTVRDNGIKALEYGRYYLPVEASRLDGDSACYLFDVLFKLATREKVVVVVRNGLEERCIRAWRRLPPVIRCAALMNDIRKLDSNWNKKLEPPDRNSMQIPNISNLSEADQNDQNYQIGKSAGHYGVRFLSEQDIDRDNGIFDLSWSWNRDEAHVATVTYRYNLCPLWARPPGHMAGNIAYWASALGTKFPTDGAAALCSALFSLWRLYYDRRISGDHTLVETFEATLITPSAKSYPLGGFSDITALNPWPLDSYEAVKCCVFDGFSAVDPVRLIRLLINSNLPTTDDANNTIDSINNILRDAQQSLAKDYWLPQWSHDLSETIGTDVLHLLPIELKVTVTDDNSQTIVTTTIDVHFDKDPGLFEMNVGPQGAFTVFDIKQVKDDPTRYTATTTALPYNYSSKAEIRVIKPENRILIYPIGKSIVGGQSVSLDVQLS